MVSGVAAATSAAEFAVAVETDPVVVELTAVTEFGTPGCAVADKAASGGGTFVGATATGTLSGTTVLLLPGVFAGPLVVCPAGTKFVPLG